MTTVQSSIAGVTGFSVAGVHAGLKKNGALDMTLIVSATPCQTAGVFTRNTVKAAPVLVDMEHLRDHAGEIRAVAVNTRCANASTGELGLANAREMARYTAEKLGCSENQVLVMSTGVIGSQLPMDKIKHGLDLATAGLGGDWNAAAHGIMTTDTRPKSASVAIHSADGRTYHIAGIAKGAGMIAPNMATMLSAIVTDAGLSQADLQTALSRANEGTFNCIVVDGDTSTNDTVLLLANGASGVMVSDAADLAAFQAGLDAVCRSLAQAVVRDGEGATKFITLSVTGAASDADAKQIANAIATSPLVKTAFFGNDANWGRIVAAAGRSGIAVDPAQMKLWFTPGEVYALNDESLLLFSDGIPTGYDEARATAIIKHAEVSVQLTCGAGAGQAIVWTCDLSHDYVSINGDYRS